jgi:hypothetical protein
VLDKPVLDKLDRDGPCQQKLKSLPCRQAGLFLNLFIICLAFLLTPATSVYGITQVTNTITVTATIVRLHLPFCPS